MRLVTPWMERLDRRCKGEMWGVRTEIVPATKSTVGLSCTADEVVRMILCFLFVEEKHTFFVVGHVWIVSSGRSYAGSYL